MMYTFLLTGTNVKLFSDLYRSTNLFLVRTAGQLNAKWMVNTVYFMCTPQLDPLLVPG